jgi:hypothetical protein
LPGEVTHVPYGDVAALQAAVDGATAMVLLEPIQGESGVVVPPAGYLTAAREITARHGALLALDEVQTGIGRTGYWFAHQAEGVRPDVVTLAKGLGGGLPLGALIAFGDAATLLGPGMHATTFGGNPVCCAAALAVLDTIASEACSTREAARRAAAPRASRRSAPAGRRVRGAGLLLGIVLSGRPAAGGRAAATPASCPGGPAGRAAARPAADPHRRAGRRLPRRARPALMGVRMTGHFLRDDDLTPASSRRCSTWRRDEGRPARHRPLAGPLRSPSSSRSRRCAPGSRSRSASPNSAGTR